MDYCLTGKQKTLLKFSFQQVKEVVPKKKKQQNFAVWDKKNCVTKLSKQPGSS
jgi:hypothetical protein